MLSVGEYSGVVGFHSVSAGISVEYMAAIFTVKQFKKALLPPPPTPVEKSVTSLSIDKA
jgi:hypothetical protein